MTLPAHNTHEKGGARMRRMAITIVLNGLHHLTHNDFALKMAKWFDEWVIVEGASNNGGSTKWCNPALEDYHEYGNSIDGTARFLHHLSGNNYNVHTVFATGVWSSKDEMVNAGIERLEHYRNGEHCFLWEVDVDEQWTLDSIKLAEAQLMEAGAKTGMFLADYYVGKGLVARGEWGEGRLLPYNRLWLWNGEGFRSHEPPVLANGNEPAILLPQRFNHYAYYFEKDVLFKDAWYGRHQGLYLKWQALQELPRDKFPVPINELLPFQWGGGQTEIHTV